MTIAANSRAVFLWLVLVVGLGTMPLSPVSAADKPRTLSIRASGTVLVDPDRVAITTGVTTEAQTAAAALSRNSAAMTAIVEALKADGIDRKDIQTTNFSVRPRYRSYRDKRAQQITGYVVTNSVRIRLHKISRLGVVLDRVVALGSNQISGIRFYASRADELRDEARKAAFANALRKANVYAKAAGVDLGEVVRLSEGHRVSTRPVTGFARTASAPHAPPPIEAGQQSLTVNVHVTWSLQ